MEKERDDVHKMTTRLREGIVNKKPPVKLQKEAECDEVHIIAGRKGNPEAVKKRRKGRLNRLKGCRGRGTLKKEKPPVFGMIQRSVEVHAKILK